MKELHIYLDKLPEEDIIYTFINAEKALLNNQQVVHTTQIHFCSTTWLVKGYRLFVHMPDEKIIEITLGYCGDVGREIRVGHNIEKMLLAGVFGSVGEYEY